MLVEGISELPWEYPFLSGWHSDLGYNDGKEAPSFQHVPSKVHQSTTTSNDTGSGWLAQAASLLLSRSGVSEEQANESLAACF